MSEVRAIDIEEAASTVQRGLVGIQVQIADLTATMKDLTAVISRILEEEGI
mgnify:FL=1|jgi:hypothetical protein|tara:strand:+ start:480 stop:632 length:153 start_codon:yes stop_codon:yes gene_type:complete